MRSFQIIAPASVPAYIVARLVGGVCAVLAIYPDVTPADAAEIILPHEQAASADGAGVQVGAR